MRTLTVVSPVYNEERVILAFHEELRRALAGLAGWKCSVLYVVDRGSDRSLDLLRALAAADPASRCWRSRATSASRRRCSPGSTTATPTRS